MLHQYSVLDNKKFTSKLKRLANEYSPWGKLKFSDMAPFFGGLCEEMGEKDLKKSMLSETSYDFIVKPGSELESSFRKAITNIGLEDEFLKSYRRVLERKDAGVSHVLLYAKYGDLTLKKAPIIKFNPTEFQFFTNKMPKKKMLYVGLEWYGEKFTPEVQKYIEKCWIKHIVSFDTYRLLESVFPNILFEPVTIETKTTQEEWCALILENVKETSIHKFKDENEIYTIFDFELEEFKQSNSFVVDEHTFLLTVKDFDFLVNEKVFPKSHKSWLGSNGFWSLRYF